MNKIKLVSEWQLLRTARKWQFSGVKSPRWAADQLKDFSVPYLLKEKKKKKTSKHRLRLTSVGKSIALQA